MIVVNENVTHMKLKYPHMIIEKEIEKTLEIPQEQRDKYIYIINYIYIFIIYIYL